MLMRVLLAVVALLCCTHCQTVTLPSSLTIPAGKCTSISISRSSSSPDILSVTFNYNTSSGLTWNNTSTGSFILSIPSNSVTSNSVLVCANNSSPGTSTTTAILSNSSYTIVGGSNAIATQVTTQNVVVPSGNLVVPRGGCSGQQTVTVSALPNNALTLLLNSLAGSGYYIKDSRTSVTAATFSNTSATTSNTFFICSYYNNTSPLSISPVLSGVNLNQYTINNGQGSTLSLSVGSTPVAVAATLVATTPVNGTSTDILVGISTDVEGVLYYQVRDYDDTYAPTDPLDFTYVKALAMGNTQEVRIHNQSDFLTYLNIKNRDLRVNQTVVLPGTTQILVDQPLLPGLNYQICQWFQSLDLTLTTPIPCTNLSIPYRTWPIYQTAYQFTAPLGRQQRNNLLRWLSTNISAPIFSVINLRGQSANSTGGTWPSRPYYSYRGQTNDSSNTQTVYVMTQDNGGDSGYVTNLKGLFSNTGSTLGANTLNSISSAVGVNLVSGQLVGSQQYMGMRNDTNRSVSNWKATYDNSSVTITNIIMSNGNGVVYFGIANTSVSVSSQNLINCVDSSNSTSLLGCARIALRSGQNGTLTFPNITSTSPSSLQVLSVSSNSYLLRPILISSSNPQTSSVTLGNNFVTTNPNTITVAPGACQNVNVSVGTWSYTNVTITGTPSNSNVSVSSDVIVVNGQTLNPLVRVCAVSGSALGNSTITWSYSGTNAIEYTSTTTNLSIVVPLGDITVPTALTIPIGSCSDPFTINSTTLPPQDVYLVAGNNTNYYFPNSTDGSYLHFNQTSKSIIFDSEVCSYESSNGGPINMTIGGVNGNLYTVNGGNTTVVGVTQSSPPTPSIYFQANPVKYNDGTNVTISVVTNRQGWVYYALTQGNQDGSIWTLSTIKSFYNTGNYYVWNQSDFSTRLYPYPRDARVNRTLVYAGRDNWISHSNLLPSTLYTICGYYSNDDGSVTSSTRNCSQFITNSTLWPVYRAILNFTRQLSAVQRNRLLCYFVAAVGPIKNRYLVNLRSQSCNQNNVNSTPASQYYNYTGTTASVGGTEVIFLLTEDNSSSVGSAAVNFVNMFDPNTNQTTVSASSAISSATGVTLVKGQFDGAVPLVELKTSNRTALIGNAIGDGPSISVNNIALLGGHGLIYFGVTNSSWPTVEQLLNCGYNNTFGNSSFFNCTRLCIPRGENTSLSFTNVGYATKIYYIATNSYPVRPYNTTNNVSILFMQRGIFGLRTLLPIFLLFTMLLSVY